MVARFALSISLFFLILLISVNSHSQVLFQDNYDSHPDWICNDGWQVLSGYTGQSSCYAPQTHNGVTKPNGEISYPGRGGTGKSLKLWRRNGGFQQYHGYLDKYFTSAEFAANKYKELFFKWDMKMPVAGRFFEGWTMKFNRHMMGTAAGINNSVWHVVWQDNRLVFDNTAASNWNHKSQRTVTEMGIDSGEWFSLEIHIKLNSTTGSTDGGFTFYVNGVEERLCNLDGINNCITSQDGYLGAWDYNTGVTTDTYFTAAFPPAIGNLGASDDWNFPTDDWYAIEFDNYVVSTSYIGPAGEAPPLVKPPEEPPPVVEDPVAQMILSDGFESGTDANWQCDYVQGDSFVSGDAPIFAGNYAFRQVSTASGNYVHCFADNANLGGAIGDQVTDFVLEEYYYPQVGFLWPTSTLKLWIINAFQQWGAGYNLAAGQSKPHTWAPYYFTIAVDSSGQLFGDLTRADGLGGTGVRWEGYYQNQGSPVALTIGAWNKVKFRVKLNDSGQSNGIFSMWLNDTLIAHHTNMNFRGTYTDKGWNHLMMSFHGMNHPQSQYVVRDNIKLKKGFELSNIEIAPSPLLRLVQ